MNHQDLMYPLLSSTKNISQSKFEGFFKKSIQNIYCVLFRNVFNWTWSYKNNSDIYHPYGYGFFPKAEKPPSHHWKQRNLELYDMNR